MATRVTSSRLVGREGELAELEAAFADAESGAPALALVAGDSGVGKTRLVAELVAGAEERGGHTLSGDCVDLGDGELPYAPLLAALRPLARDSDPVLAALPAAMRAELTPLMPALGEGPAGPLDGRDPGAQGRLFEAVLTLLHELGELAPVCSCWRTSTGPTAPPARCSPTWRGASSTSACSSWPRTGSTSCTAAIRSVRCWPGWSETRACAASNSRR